MTRSALRILNRARANAWRRVGIPAEWTPPPPPAAEPAPAPANQTGQNVAGTSNGNAGTSHTSNGTNDVPDSEYER